MCLLSGRMLSAPWLASVRQEVVETAAMSKVQVIILGFPPNKLIFIVPFQFAVESSKI
jgi:hypothetical protein